MASSLSLSQEQIKARNKLLQKSKRAQNPLIVLSESHSKERLREGGQLQTGVGEGGRVNKHVGIKRCSVPQSPTGVLCVCSNGTYCKCSQLHTCPTTHLLSGFVVPSLSGPQKSTVQAAVGKSYEL